MLATPRSPDSGPPDLSGLDAQATLALAEHVLMMRRRAELDDLRLAAHWAALHSTDPRRSADGRRAWAEDRLVEVGGEGSPRVREFCIPELAMVRRVHPASGQALMADTLDLQHRLPRVWEQVESLAAEVWVARKVASMTRKLPLAVMELGRDA